MLNFIYPSIFQEIIKIPAGVYAYILKNQGVMVIKASSRYIAAAKLKGKVSFYFAPVKLMDFETYCVISTYEDNPRSPQIIYTPLYASEQNETLIKILAKKDIQVFFVDEKNRPWLSCDAVNLCHKKFTSFSKKIKLASLTSEIKYQRTLIEQASDWFTNTNSRDDNRAFPLILNKDTYQADYTIMDLTRNSIDYHGSSVRLTELNYENPGARQEADFAEEFTKIFPAPSIYLNPLKTINKEELCDILICGKFSHYYIQLKSSPNTEKIITRELKRSRAKALQHLKIAINQSQECLDYICNNDTFEICLKSNHKQKETITQNGKNMIFITVCQEFFEPDIEDYSRLAMDFIKNNNKIINVLSESVLYKYLLASENEEDFFKITISDFSILRKTGKLPDPTSANSRAFNLKYIDTK